MPEASPDLLAAVQSGTARRLPLEELNGYEYFADRTGRVYSLNSDEPRLVEAKTGWAGLEWVVLMTSDGWKRYCLGELIAEAFLGEQRPGGRDDYTVAYVDGDARNNAATNLRWVTRLEASRARSEVRQRTATAPPSRPTVETAPVAVSSETAVESAPGPTGTAATESREVLKLIERNRRTQERLEALTGEHQRLMAALTPFAEFADTPEMRVGHPDHTVLEANKGRPTYRRVTVGDLRRALEVMRELERGRS
jgi:hypothetical protein